ADSRQSTVHAASLVDPATHSPALIELLDSQLSDQIIDYVVDCVIETVEFGLGQYSSTDSATPHDSTVPHNLYVAKFASFVTTVLIRAEVTTPTLLTALVYIVRARPHLIIALPEWALERVFLGALIVASKYTHDSTLKNAHWSLCTGVFGKRDIGRIEREYLEVMAWELSVGEDDLLAHRGGFMAAASP
ncbi:hypothetical protein C8R43DRAFT_852573, partial [Mycena crocata]